MKTILFDCDGVLADFIQGFTSIAYRKFKTRIVTTDQQPQWDFDWLLSKQEQDLVWSEIKQTPGWWGNLFPLLSKQEFKRINELNSNANVIFGTNRLSTVDPAGRQTASWLEDYGISFPNVVLTKKKGDLARIIKADFAIDDSAENASCIHWISDSPQTKTFLINRPYNQHKVPKHVTRIDSVGNFLDEVERSL